ncbi:MAG: DegT/DnrJ/EryC1/StrS family aminotransferase [Treponema sp.]|nr:DegT/DnrJ/EryC1/StrS family aminotransferase [Treponema sp.]
MKIEVYSPTIRRKEMDAVLTVMVEEKIGPGERNRLLIQTAKEQLHFDYALALRSPAVALHLALKALNVKQGQAVVISALSPRYYLQVLQDLRLTPLYCDVTYDFPCMSRELIENTIAKNTAEHEGIAAVVVHHTLGFVPDSAGIAELGFPVIEDISQSYGSWFKPDEAVPVFNSQFTILGLEERDMLTSGGGALLFAMNRKDAAILRTFSGTPDEYCLPDINSALAIVQFKEVHRNLDRRRDIAKIFTQASMRTRHKRFISINDNEYCNYSFSLVLETGLKDVVAYAKKKEILLENAFTNTIAGAGLSENTPVCSSLVLRTVLFPIYPRLRSQDAERISRLIMTLP